MGSLKICDFLTHKGNNMTIEEKVKKFCEIVQVAVDAYAKEDDTKVDLTEEFDVTWTER